MACADSGSPTNRCSKYSQCPTKKKGRTFSKAPFVQNSFIQAGRPKAGGKLIPKFATSIPASAGYPRQRDGSLIVIRTKMPRSPPGAPHIGATGGLSPADPSDGATSAAVRRLWRTYIRDAGRPNLTCPSAVARLRPAAPPSARVPGPPPVLPTRSGSGAGPAPGR
jgi:hypothetical protein